MDISCSFKGNFRYRWPGNVRELENVVKRAVVVVSGEVIGVNDLILNTEPYRKELQELSEVIESIFNSALAIEDTSGLYHCIVSSVEKSLVKEALRITKGNQVQASALLGITRMTLRKKIQELNIPSA